MLGRVFRIFQEAGHVRIGGGVETLLREREGAGVAQTRDPKAIFLNGKVGQKPYNMQGISINHLPNYGICNY